MRFESPEAFWFFLPLAFLLIFTFLRERKRLKKINELFSLRNREKMGLEGRLNLQSFFSRIFLYSFVACMILAWARPQKGQSEREELTSEHSVVFLIDLSRSMLSSDISPSRLRLTKKEIIRSFKKLSGIKVGLVGFAGSAAVISPMTTDLSALEVYIDSLSTTTIGTQGTEILAALEEAKFMFNRVLEKEDFKKTGEKVIVLFSDGERHEEKSLEMVKNMTKEGFRIFTVGVGTESGGYIPQFEGSKTYLKNNDGQLAVSKPNYKFLKKLAKTGKGSFYSLNPSAPFSAKLEKDLLKIDSANSSKRKFVVKSEIFQIPLYVGFFFFVLFLLLRKKR